MFARLKNLFGFLRRRSVRHLVLLLTGLDNAGKTTLLAAIRGEVPGDTRPTWGFNRRARALSPLALDLLAVVARGEGERGPGPSARGPTSGGAARPRALAARRWSRTT